MDQVQTPGPGLPILRQQLKPQTPTSGEGARQSSIASP